jgi:DNA mismatch repair protein MutS
MRPMKLTPMLEQYFELKRQVPDAILFFRLGDFYEMFFEDAEKAAPILDLVLTARGKGGEAETPMCGVPHHSAEQHIAKLIRHGLRVAICEQVEDPSAAKGIVRRDIVRIITPGTATDANLLDRESCYLLSLVTSKEGAVGAAFLDTSTGDFFVSGYAQCEDPKLRDDIARFAPREAIVPASDSGERWSSISSFGAFISRFDDVHFEQRNAFDLLTRHFATQNLRGFGLDDHDVRIAAAGAAFRYAESSHKRELKHVTALRVDHAGDFLTVDASTLQNLEVFESRDSRSKASLWNIINMTKSAVGARSLRMWMCRPLRDRAGIFERHDAVDELTRDRLALEEIQKKLARIADLERLSSRVTLRSATPREVHVLVESLRASGELRGIVAGLEGPMLRSLAERIDPLDDVSAEIERIIAADSPPSVRDGGAIREGVDRELDELRAIARDSKSILLRIETNERARTGISSLKIRFNSVFGYYIEISKANLAKVPADYIRKQTLVNAERYITPELKELEEKITGAEEKAVAIELRIYEALLAFISSKIPVILTTARATGEIDALQSLATLSIKRRYVRASLSDECEVEIRDGRHPVVEAILTERFIPNDTDVLQQRDGIQIITGPNMGGKSTYLRQVALIVLLNQIGSFVPASSARLGIFDRVFTRVGASDNLARGESTFMVEMQETANILNNATSRSLVILDEVGRGTSTFDGLSLAWAIVEFLHDQPARSAITLFATHYHELTDLSRTRDRVRNYNVSVREWNDQIIFLRKVVEGAADKSYGLQVAKLAGIPQSVIDRAREVLGTIERKERAMVEATRPAAGAKAAQIPLFDSAEESVMRELRDLRVENMTPLEALNALHNWKSKLTES